MKKTTLNLIVDTLALGAFILLAASGALIRYVLPPGSGHSSTLWGWNRHDWGRVHFWIAVALLATIGIHIYLHWRWIVQVVLRHSRRLAVAIPSVAFILVLALIPFLAPVESTGEDHHECDAVSIHIDGSMTLSEVETQTGVPTREILGELGLPPDLPSDERLGRLRRAYGFEMKDVREVVRRHADPG